MIPIPKILHLYWDRSPMAYLQTLTVSSFHSQNPDWEIRLYVPKNRSTIISKYVPDYTGQDYFSTLLSLDYVKVLEADMNAYGLNFNIHEILRSDIFRYLMLYEYGGVWSDFDVIWLKPIEAMESLSVIGNVPIQNMGAMTCIYQDRRGIKFSNIGVLLTKANHPFYKELTAACFDILSSCNIRSLQHQTFGVHLWDRLYPSFDMLKAKYFDMLAFPYRAFYPFSVFELKLLFEDNSIHKIKDAICVHWFNGHKFAKQYINSGMHNYCSMTDILKQIKQI